MSSQSLSSLFTPVDIGQIALKHRIVMPAMSRLRAHWPSGDASNEAHWCALPTAARLWQLHLRPS
jgi:2,4-dienoyl-CoA reductase-like NADH-dependent reductase (Old Yellow Enzyme family)